MENIARQFGGSHFLGIYDWKDKLPLLRNHNDFILINKLTNQHWIASKNVGGHIFTYDAFDRPEYEGGNLAGDKDLIPDESPAENNCGQRSLAWCSL